MRTEGCFPGTVKVESLTCAKTPELGFRECVAQDANGDALFHRDAQLLNSFYLQSFHNVYFL